MNQTINLKGRSYLAEKDFSEEEILYLLDLAQKLKEKSTRHQASLFGRQKHRFAV